MNSELHPSTSVLLDEIAKMRKETVEEIDNDSAEVLLSKIRFDQQVLPVWGVMLQTHVDNLEGILASSELSLMAHSAHMAKHRVLTWTEKFFDEQLIPGFELHFMQVKLDILLVTLKAVKTAHEVHPKHLASVNDYWVSM